MVHRSAVDCLTNLYSGTPPVPPEDHVACFNPAINILLTRRFNVPNVADGYCQENSCVYCFQMYVGTPVPAVSLAPHQIVLIDLECFTRLRSRQRDKAACTHCSMKGEEGFRRKECCEKERVKKEKERVEKENERFEKESTTTVTPCSRLRAIALKPY